MHENRGGICIPSTWHPYCTEIAAVHNMTRDGVSGLEVEQSCLCCCTIQWNRGRNCWDCRLMGRYGKSQSQRKTRSCNNESITLASGLRVTFGHMTQLIRWMILVSDHHWHPSYTQPWLLSIRGQQLLQVLLCLSLLSIDVTNPANEQITDAPPAGGHSYK